MKALAFVLFVTLLGFSFSSEGKEIALTFDDAPRGDSYLSGTERSQQLLEGLKNSCVQMVAFFVNTERLDEAGAQRITDYSLSGHLIANHTHSHRDLNRVTVGEYAAEINKAQVEVMRFPTVVPWFRYPYLREGDTPEKRDGIREVLEALGLRNAYITVNTSNWYMDHLFHKAIKSKKKIDFKRLGELYVEVLVSQAEYYDEMARAVLNRSPRHVLLLHENDLAALFIFDLVTALRRRDWTIINPGQAYKDEIASYRTSSLFPFNPGRIGEIASDTGWTGKLWAPYNNEKELWTLLREREVFK